MVSVGGAQCNQTAQEGFIRVEKDCMVDGVSSDDKIGFVGRDGLDTYLEDLSEIKCRHRRGPATFGEPSALNHGCAVERAA